MNPMHYKKAPRLRLSSRRLRRCTVPDDFAPWVARSIRLQANSEEVYLGGTQECELSRHSFLRNSLRAVLAVKGPLRSRPGRALDRSGPL